MSVGLIQVGIGEDTRVYDSWEEFMNGEKDRQGACPPREPNIREVIEEAVSNYGKLARPFLRGDDPSAALPPLLDIVYRGINGLRRDRRRPHIMDLFYPIAVRIRSDASIKFEFALYYLGGLCEMLSKGERVSSRIVSLVERQLYEAGLSIKSRRHLK